MVIIWIQRKSQWGYGIPACHCVKFIMVLLICVLKFCNGECPKREPTTSTLNLLEVISSWRRSNKAQTPVILLCGWPAKATNKTRVDSQCELATYARLVGRLPQLLHGYYILPVMFIIQTILFAIIYLYSTIL